MTRCVSVTPFEDTTAGTSPGLDVSVFATPENDEGTPWPHVAESMLDLVARWCLARLASFPFQAEHIIHYINHSRSFSSSLRA